MNPTDKGSSHLSLETMVIKIIRDDPFVSIREIKEILKRKYHQDHGWWSIFRVLRKNKILKKRNRFRYVRNVY